MFAGRFLSFVNKRAYQPSIWNLFFFSSIDLVAWFDAPIWTLFSYLAVAIGGRLPKRRTSKENYREDITVVSRQETI